MNVLIVPCLMMALQSAEGSNVTQQAVVGGGVQTGFLFKTLAWENEKYNFCVYVPPDYTPEKPWPLILFLHGSGERGSDGFLQTEVGIARAIRRDHSRVPAIVVMPQARAGATWVGPMARVALKCVEQTSAEYRVDPKRLYLTGMSLGGQGAWRIGAEYADKWAAIVPICGFLDKLEASKDAEVVAAKLAKMPIWCVHGTADTAVPVDRSREVIAALRAAGCTPTYDEVKDGNHNVWDHAYEDAKMWAWLFAQKRSD